MRTVIVARPRGICILVGLVIVSHCASSALALEGIWIVRHAEKLQEWPGTAALDRFHPLSETGLERARRLADRLSGQPLVVVVASPTTRCLHTGLPSALEHGVELRAEEATLRRDGLEKWLQGLNSEFPGPGWALVVGHSNTVPWLLEALGATPSCHERLGIRPHGYGPGVDGYEGLWSVRLEGEGCDAIERHEQ